MAVDDVRALDRIVLAVSARASRSLQKSRSTEPSRSSQRRSRHELTTKGNPKRSKPPSCRARARPRWHGGPPGASRDPAAGSPRRRSTSNRRRGQRRRPRAEIRRDAEVREHRALRIRRDEDGQVPVGPGPADPGRRRRAGADPACRTRPGHRCRLARERGAATSSAMPAMVLAAEPPEQRVDGLPLEGGQDVALPRMIHQRHGAGCRPSAPRAHAPP